MEETVLCAHKMLSHLSAWSPNWYGPQAALSWKWMPCFCLRCLSCAQGTILCLFVVYLTLNTLHTIRTRWCASCMFCYSLLSSAQPPADCLCVCLCGHIMHEARNFATSACSFQRKQQLIKIQVWRIKPGSFNRAACFVLAPVWEQRYCVLYVRIFLLW